MASDPSACDTTGEGGAAALGECAALLRRHDRDRYLAVLMAPRAGQAALFGLYAFNIEIARVREIVSEPVLGQIRLQWWRDALEGVYAGASPRRHAVAEVLAGAVERHALPREAFERMIDAREFDLEERRPATMDALADYAAATGGTLAALAARALGAAGEGAQAAAEEAGTAWALAGLLRAVPFHAAQRRCYLPRDTLADESAVAELFEGRVRPAVAAAVAAVADRARLHLAVARGRAGAIPRRALAAIVPATLIDRDLRRLARAEYNPFALPPPSPLGRQLRLMWAAARGRI